jgi:hypothetical protein
MHNDDGQQKKNSALRGHAHPTPLRIQIDTRVFHTKKKARMKRAPKVGEFDLIGQIEQNVLQSADAR